MKIETSLKDFRESRGLTQQALADRLGVAKNYIYLIESGRKPMTAGLRRKLDDLEKGESNQPGQLDGETNNIDITARLDELSTRLSALERLLLQVLSRLPPPAP